VIARRKIDIVAKQRVEKIDNLRTLDSDTAKIRTAIF
jgi:hypothetical protein